jgi:hypothetical protein
MRYSHLIFVVIFTTVFSLVSCQGNTKPRVFIFTDINIDRGDPDDRQSLVHLLWYADELEIRGIVPERWNAEGYEASIMAVEAYSEDYDKFNFQSKGFPGPGEIRDLIARDSDHAFKLFSEAASESSDPLYVLIWGAMSEFGNLLNRKPELADNIRVITIGTGLMYPPNERYAPDHWPRGAPCALKNWNGPGRSQVWNNPRFNNMWWLELNWTYNGMFTGNEPRQMFEKLSGYGALGQHMVDVTKNEPWAQYFRVGDTPSVLYVIDPRGNQDDPRQSSWAGHFIRPLPDDRPNYYADHSGPAEWDYADPCSTWDNYSDVYEFSKATLEKERPGMYRALIEKLERIYGRSGR